MDTLLKGNYEFRVCYNGTFMHSVKIHVELDKFQVANLSTIDTLDCAHVNQDFLLVLLNKKLTEEDLKHKDEIQFDWNPYLMYECFDLADEFDESDTVLQDYINEMNKRPYSLEQVRIKQRKLAEEIVQNILKEEQN